MFSFDSLERGPLGVRGAKREEEVERRDPEGGGEVDDARDERDGRGDTEAYLDEMCEEGDAECVWAIWRAGLGFDSRFRPQEGDRDGV